MRVQRVLMPDDGVESWTVLGADAGLLEPVEAFLAYLTSVQRSPNTVRAYAYDLRDFFQFLGERDLDWREVDDERVGWFVSWLAFPPAARGRAVTMLPVAAPHCSSATLARKLSALSAFYEFHQRRIDGDRNPVLGGRMSRRGGSSSWQPMLAHLGPQRQRSRVTRLPVEQHAPKTLTEAQVAAILAGCVRLRDRLLFTLLAETGLRVGEALGLRHEDVDAAGRLVHVRPRQNANGARAKSWSRSVPVSAATVRLYSDYLHVEYGTLDSDYVFVNLWSPPLGGALRYSAVHDLVQRLRRSTGVEFTPHAFRHTYATELLRREVPVEVVQKLLGHASYATTVDTYSHLQLEDVRRALEKAGVLTAETSR